jgi:S-disulfanyl-L-cysteine oxidoreductase SoxD
MNKTKVTLAALIVAVSTCVAVTATMADSSPTSQWDGVYTKAQANRGESLYAQNCLICHGQDLLGGEMAPPLIGGQFQSNWNEQTLGDLFERIRISMPLTAPGSLSRQQVADVLAYLLSKDSYPTRQSELPTQTEVLQATKFLSSKP